MLSAPRSIRPLVLLAVSPLAIAAHGQSPGDPPGRVGRVSSVLGTVAFQAAGMNDWSLAPLNYTVTSGDRILTSRGARAEVEVGPFDVRLSDSTDLTVVQLTDDFAQLGLSQGTLRVSVHRLAASDSMEIDTPNGALIIRSAGRYRVDVLAGVSTIVTTDDGSIELSGPGLDYIMRRGQSVELTGYNPINAALTRAPLVTDFDQWSNNRDRRQESSDCSRYVNRDIPGCADLSDHGTWHRHPEYGNVWRPARVTVGWVPYRHGHWAWSGPWGWTWVEDAPWGFAPFHYGRWVTYSGAWVWAPGPIMYRPYYTPALVVFVGGGSRHGRHFEAWFPLGWHEPYFPRYRHSDRYLRQVNITNVTNVTNINVFVDQRRADRIDYAHRREATTAVAAGSFGRGRPVLSDAVNLRPDDVQRAPIVRARWDAQLVPTPGSSRNDAPATFGPRRATVATEGEATPTPRRAEPRVEGAESARERAPLVTRNTPPIDTRRSATSPRRAGGDGSPRPEAEPSDRSASTPLVRRQAGIQRRDVGAQPSSGDARDGDQRATVERNPVIGRVGPSGRTPTIGSTERTGPRLVERDAEPREAVTSGRQPSARDDARSSPPRQESRPASSREAGRTSAPRPEARSSSPRQSASPRSSSSGARTPSRSRPPG